MADPHPHTGQHRGMGRGTARLVIGWLCGIGLAFGIVVLLRRRDFREMRSHYGNSDSSLSDLGKD